MNETELFARLPLKLETDVLIVGGGPSGVAAAVTAARHGARTALIEGTACAGGLGTSGLVPSFMPFGDEVHFYSGGVGRELLDRALAAGGVVDEPPCYPIHPEYLKRVYDDMLMEARVDFMYLTRFIAVESSGGRIDHVVLAGSSGLFAAKASVYVDATGDGDLAAWAGAPFEKGDASGLMMPATLCGYWGGVDWKAVRWPDDRMLEQAFADGVFTRQDRHLTGMFRCGRTLAGSNAGHMYGMDGTNEASLTRGLVEGRAQMLEYQRYYRNYLEGYSGVRHLWSGALPGIRETRRITGQYMLSVEDFKTRASFPDEIGRFSYPVDIHPSDDSPEEMERFNEEWESLRYEPGESYGIPYRCLLPLGFTNLLVAGRCVSADRQMQSSVRVMPGCYITGQAAGMAAAMAARAGQSPGDVNTERLRRNLAAIGAFLPEHGGGGEA